jgi:hypothetical protein
LAARKADGGVDRSLSLVFLARALYHAGLAGRYLAAELEASDLRLGWRKYTGRADAAKCYGDIAAGTIARSRRSRPVIHLGHPSAQDERSGPEPSPDGTDAPPCPGCRQRDQDIAALRERIARLDQREAIRRNRGLGSAREGAAEVAQAVLDLAAAGPPPDERGYEVPQWGIQRQTGITVETLRRHVKAIAGLPLAADDCERLALPPETPLWRVETEQVPKIVTTPDGRTTQDGSVSRLFLKPTVPVERLAETLAVVALPTAKRHGGARCRRHPDAELVTIVTLEKRTRRLCSVCQDEVSSETEVIRTLVGPSGQDECSESDAAADPEPNPPSGQDERSALPTTEDDAPVIHMVDNLSARERTARAAAERRGRTDDARRLLDRVRRQGISVRRAGDGLIVMPEARLSDRDAGLIAELQTELCWLLDLEAARSSA